MDDEGREVQVLEVAYISTVVVPIILLLPLFARRTRVEGAHFALVTTIITTC